MFDFLSQSSTEQATTSVYYATRLIRHVKHIRGAKDGLRVKDLKSEPSVADELLAKRIISEIEANERSSLADLDEAKAEEYIQRLADVLQTLLKNNLKYDEERGRDLLGELRKDKSHAFGSALYIRHLTKFSSQISRWASYGGLIIFLLAFVYGIRLIQIPPQNNPTKIEGTIALLNIFLAVWVLFDSRSFIAADILGSNSVASRSFRQLLLGWRSLWVTWILFYGCLAAQWFHLINDVLSPIVGQLAEALNLINGFFFYYLFFVLDQPSVATKTEPDRAKSFRRNCIVTLILGVLLFIINSPLLNGYIGGNEGLSGKLLPAYIAVGMAFFFGRLDSHYLRLPRIILAPLYLYAIIQLFWDRSTFADNSKFIPQRIIVFSTALILKFVVFITLSRLIKHKSFHQYFVIAEKELREN